MDDKYAIKYQSAISDFSTTGHTYQEVRDLEALNILVSIVMPIVK